MENVIHLYEYANIGNRLDIMFVNSDRVNYFDSFEAEYSRKDIKNFKGNKIFKTNHL